MTYIAPEVVAQCSATTKSDVYSMGLVFAEIICKFPLMFYLNSYISDKQKLIDFIKSDKDNTKLYDINNYDNDLDVNNMSLAYTTVRVNEDVLLGYIKNILTLSFDKYYDFSDNVKTSLISLIQHMLRRKVYDNNEASCHVHNTGINRLSASEVHDILIKLWNEST